MRAIYVIGAPGSGKSTLTRAFGDALSPIRVQQEKPVPHVLIGATGWVEVGRDRGAFGGTDGLGYSIGPSAVAWVTGEQRPRCVVGEGDRLATAGFLGALGERYDLTVFHLHIDPAVAWARVEERAARLGRETPNVAWWTGRVTKARNLARVVDATELDATLATEVLVKALISAAD